MSNVAERLSDQHVVNRLERIILSSRYLLVPMYAGLALAMGAYCYVFSVELWHMVLRLGGAGDKAAELVLCTLALLDEVMIANLIIMVTIGGYSIFIREISDIPNSPRFLKTLTSGTLKVKMSASIVGISAVRLVVTFINVATVPWEVICKQLAVHGVFLIGVLVFTYMEAQLHPLKAQDSHT